MHQALASLAVDVIPTLLVVLALRHHYLSAGSW
jgi:hypothetical protein